MKLLKNNALLIALIVIQIIIYILVGSQKVYLHMDEAYSFGLSNYDKVEIQDNADFYNTWHNSEYYKDYLTIQSSEAGDFTPIYQNQKNDVHPPLYYLLLRIFMEFSGENFSVWTGIILNIIIYVFITIFMYLILTKLFKNDAKFKTKSAILAFVSSVTLASISNVIYIRMYTLLTLEILITVFLHIKFLENANSKILLGIGILALAGILTQYYYLFFIAFLYIVMAIIFIKNKNWKALVTYTFAMISAGLISLIIFPYMLNHIFLGYRGKSVASNIKSFSQIIGSFLPNINNLNYYGFNNLLYVILILILIMAIYNKRKKLDIDGQTLSLILIPSLAFFIISAIISPWKVLRYIVPVCSLIFIIAIFVLYKLFQNNFSEKTANIIIATVLLLILILPFILKLKPELLYDDKQDIVEFIDDNSNLPAIFLNNSSSIRFLDDILLFTKIKESYITKSTEHTSENIAQILNGKDISNGVIIFINGDDGKDELLQIVEDATNLSNAEHLEKLFSCDVYLVY